MSGSIDRRKVALGQGRVAARHTSAVLIVARVGGRPGTAFPIQGRATPVALDVHLEDGGMVHQPVDGSERHGRIGEDPTPLAEGLVGGDHQGAALVAGADQLEQHARLGLILGYVGEVVEDQQVEAVEPADGRLQAEVAPGNLQLFGRGRWCG